MIPIKKYDLDPDKTVMIGNDYISDMSGAAKANLHGIYIHQDISTPILDEEKIIADYKIMDGDFRKIKEFIER